MANATAYTGSDAAQRNTDERARAPARRHARRILRYGLFALGAVVLIVGGLGTICGGRYVSTDDAYVQANVLNVSTDVSGLVDQIEVHEGEHVTKGQVLFRLDPDKFQLAVDNARRQPGADRTATRSR